MADIRHTDETTLRIRFVMKGQCGKKAHSAVNARKNSLNINPLTHPFAPRRESTDPLLSNSCGNTPESGKQKPRRGWDYTRESSKTSLSTKAADFRDANAVYLLYPFILSITCC